MTNTHTQDPGRQDEQTTYTKLRAVRDLTAGCPCDRCPGREPCRVSGHECDSFKIWTRTGHN